MAGEVRQAFIHAKTTPALYEVLDTWYDELKDWPQVKPRETLGHLIAAGTPTILVFTNSPGDTRAGVAFTNQPVIEVRDTLVALGALGRYRRCAWAKPVVGVVVKHCVLPIRFRRAGGLRRERS